MKDKVIENVVNKTISRSEVGIKKYNKTLDRDDLLRKDWLLHLQEELQDAVNYIEAEFVRQERSKFKVGDKAYKPKGYKFPCEIRAIFTNTKGEVRLVAEMEDNGMLHIFNESQLELLEDENI